METFLADVLSDAVPTMAPAEHAPNGELAVGEPVVRLALVVAETFAAQLRRCAAAAAAAASR